MKLRRYLGLCFTFLPLIPSIVFAQTTLHTYIIEFGKFLNKLVVPLLIAFAFTFFVWNAVRYFIIGGASSESQQKAKMLAVWGVLAFVVIVSIWGLTNILVSSLGLGSNTIICPDYFTNCK